MTADILRSLVGRGPLLLDFDGPVCGIFAGLPAPTVAAELVSLLQAANVAVPDQVAAEPDPLAVLRWTGLTCAPELTRAVEDALCALELRAIESASPTPFGHETIRAARSAGLPVAVVSNNSAAAIRAYLAAHHLTEQVGPVVGRPYAAPQLMKPEPEPILEAVRMLGADSARCVLVGDSLTDIQGARAAGVPVIGYANRQSKIEAFSSADAVITTMADLVETLPRVSPLSLLPPESN